MAQFCANSDIRRWPDCSDPLPETGGWIHKCDLVATLDQSELRERVDADRRNLVTLEDQRGLLRRAGSDSESAARDNSAKIYDFCSHLSQIDGQRQQIETRF